jgi:hypothetical protein
MEEILIYIKFHISDLYAKPGDDVTLPCNVQKSTNGYIWYRDFDIVGARGRAGYEFYKHLKNTGTPRAHIDTKTGDLTIFSVKESDQQFYYCKGDNSRRSRMLLSVYSGNLIIYSTIAIK